MTRHSEVQNNIRKCFSTLPRNQKKIADFFIENLDLIPFLSVHEVAKATSSSVASIVRFTQRIGYDGYSSMREHVGSTIQKHLKSEGVFPVHQKKPLKGDTLASIAAKDIDNITQTMELIPRETFHKTVQALLSARTVYTAGLGISQLMSQIFAYQLNQIGVHASALLHGSASFAEQSLYFDTKDMLVVFSFPPYSKETIDLAKRCQERKVPVIAITNKSTAPVSFSALHTLTVKSDNMLFTNSFAALAVLVNAISTDCALKQRTRAERMLRNLNQIIKNQQETL